MGLIIPSVSAIEFSENSLLYQDDLDINWGSIKNGSIVVRSFWIRNDENIRITGLYVEANNFKPPESEDMFNLTISLPGDPLPLDPGESARVDLSLFYESNNPNIRDFAFDIILTMITENAPSGSGGSGGGGGRRTVELASVEIVESDPGFTNRLIIFGLIIALTYFLYPLKNKKGRR